MKKSDISLINGRLRQVRIDAELTQEEMAAVLNTTRASVNALETGRFLPTIENMRRYSARFNISYKWIIDGIEDNSQSESDKMRTAITELQNQLADAKEMIKTLKEFNELLKKKG